MWERFFKIQKHQQQKEPFVFRKIADLICNFSGKHMRCGWFSFSTKTGTIFLNVLLNSCLTRTSRSQVFIQKKCFEKIHAGASFNVVGLQLRFFPVSSTNLSRTTILRNTYGKLLLNLQVKNLTFQKICLSCFDERYSKILQNCIHFVSTRKLFSFSRYLNFCLGFLVMQQKRLDLKYRAISKKRANITTWLTSNYNIAQYLKKKRQLIVSYTWSVNRM